MTQIRGVSKCLVIVTAYKAEVQGLPKPQQVQSELWRGVKGQRPRKRDVVRSPVSKWYAYNMVFADSFVCK